MQVEICLGIADKAKAVVEVVSMVPLPKRRMFERQSLVWGPSTDRDTFQGYIEEASVKKEKCLGPGPWLVDLASLQSSVPGGLKTTWRVLIGNSKPGLGISCEGPC